MTLEQLCNLFNVVAVVIPTVFSGGLTLTHRAAYFRSWTLSLALCALTLILETYTQGIGHAIAPTAVEVALYLASACYSFKMAAQVAGRDGRTTLYVGVAAGTFALYLGLSLAGKPFELAFMPAILYLLASQLVLGTRMIRGGGPLAMARAALGWLLIVTALWVLTYPAAVALHLVAAGFIVSGILHLVLGMGMLLLLLAEIAAGLERKNEELRAVERLQAEFIGTMNHEFRTPLNAIKTAAWLLGNSGEVDRLSARQRETVEIVSLNAERVIGLVNDVLDFSKIESGTMSYEFEVTDLNQLLERVARSLNQLFESKEIDLVLELPPEAVVADVDAQRIEQVIINLLSNALKFTHRGGRVAARLDVAEQAVRFEVEDSGIGIAEENLDRIFTKFYQVDASTTRKAGGVGLGLSISKSIVEVGHGGQMWAERLERGTLVVAQIPLPN